MSLAENAEENDANQSKFYRVLSSDPVTDANTLFDTLSKFLIKDKKRQLSTEFLDEKDKIALRLSWVSRRLMLAVARLAQCIPYVRTVLFFDWFASLMFLGNHVFPRLTFLISTLIVNYCAFKNIKRNIPTLLTHDKEWFKKGSKLCVGRRWCTT